MSKQLTVKELKKELKSTTEAFNKLHTDALRVFLTKNQEKTAHEMTKQQLNLSLERIKKLEEERTLIMAKLAERDNAIVSMAINTFRGQVVSPEQVNANFQYKFNEAR